MNSIEKISYETMKFMRGKYRLDEVGDGKDELKFKQGNKTILTIYIRNDRFTFLIILENENENALRFKEVSFLNISVIIMKNQRCTMMENGCL